MAWSDSYVYIIFLTLSIVIYAYFYFIRKTGLFGFVDIFISVNKHGEGSGNTLLHLCMVIIVSSVVSIIFMLVALPFGIW
jgi:hypothetical protein